MPAPSREDILLRHEEESKQPRDWGILGRNHQYDSQQGTDYSYSREFAGLLTLIGAKSLPDLITQRSSAGLTTNTLDIMGPGFFEGGEDCTKVTALGLHPLETPYPVNHITANAYNNTTWKKISNHDANSARFDLIFFRPKGAIRIVPKSIYQIKEAILETQLWEWLVNKGYKNMSKNESLFFLESPQYIFNTFDSDKTIRNINAMSYYIMQWYQNLLDRGVNISEARSGSDNAKVFLIQKTQGAPQELPPLKIADLTDDNLNKEALQNAIAGQL